MKSLVIGLVLMISGAVQAQDASDVNTLHGIKCTGDVSFENGSLEGSLPLNLKNNNGNWLINNHDAGQNNSADSTVLDLDNYGLFSKEGAQAVYDSKTKKITFKYKYDGGFLGGGQKTGGTFENCEEIR